MGPCGDPKVDARELIDNLGDAVVLRIRDLHVEYGALPALRGVNLDVPAGRSIAVLGSNGAGKSTLLRAISRTLDLHKGRVTGGSIEFRGASLLKMTPAAVVRRGIAQSPEGRRALGALTVEENLRLAGAVIRGRRKQAENLTRVNELFPVLADRRRQSAALLSGGQQQMLAIGRALMAEPTLLLLDEPSLGLAPLVTEQVAEMVQSIAREGVSVLLVEQNANVALRITQHAILLRLGRVQWLKESEALRHSDLSNLYFEGSSAVSNADVNESSAIRLRDALR